MGVLGAITSVFGGVVTLIQGNREAKYGRLPDWMSPSDFQRQNWNLEIALGGMALVLIIVIIAIAKSK